MTTSTLRREVMSAIRGGKHVRVTRSPVHLLETFPDYATSGYALTRILDVAQYGI